jgi:hypothetical protein
VEQVLSPHQQALKSLVVNLDHQAAIGSCASAFLIDIAAMLQDNASLESISIQSMTRIEAEDYLAFITALQGNTTLKTVSLHYERLGSTVKLHLTDDEDRTAQLHCEHSKGALHVAL